MDRIIGPSGLGLALIGGTLLFLGQRGIQRALEALPDALARTEHRLWWALLPIGIAVASYLGAREFGYGRAGLYICVALLSMNAATVAALRIRWFAATSADSGIAKRHRRSALLQMIGSWLLFIGCAVYLLRP
jgi:hypothetical protein